ncbi:MAG: indole-3-glycerol-phosphate synthase [Phycisphaeraceae bacterium]|nr:indole-3-glycerol-phosphate synthase [Phycisphaeraceae bacterium]MCW5753411.1 indole-3-glycerol-phosphate synthase [Phycisphaeraceae bacterium]
MSTPTPEHDPSRREAPKPSILDEIVLNKREEVERAKAALSMVELESLVAQADPPRNFFRAITRRARARQTAIIAEIMQRTPTAGVIRSEDAGDGFDPARIATLYERNGASAISCLTDERYFGGSLSYIQRIKEVCGLPVLRKDFLIDPWQLWESRAAGADAVLLIAECLQEGPLVDMLILAQRLGMTVLLEVHSMENLLRMRPYVGFPHPSYCLLEINNHDLSNTKPDLNHTLRLIDLVDDPSVVVSATGIMTHRDLERLAQVGVYAALVGEDLLREPDPGFALAQLLSPTSL